MNIVLALPFVVDLLLKSSVIVVVAGLILQVWRRASAAQRDCTWCIALVLIALLPLIRLIVPPWTLSLSTLIAPTASVSTMGPSESNVIPSGKIAIGSPSTTGAMLGAATLGSGIWLAGVFLLIFYRLAGAFLSDQCRHTSFRLQDNAVQALAASIGAELRMARPVHICMSDSCRVPVTWGTWRPVIMLPTEALDWPCEWMESALRHELAHVKNYDHLKRLLAFLICAFYWPNPLVWMAAKQLQLAQEEASDNLVLRIGVPPQAYAKQLIELIRLSAGQGVLSIPAVAMARPLTLEGRLSAILDETRNRADVDRRLILTGTGLALVLAWGFGAVQLRAADVSSPTGDVTQKVESPDQVASDAAHLTLINEKLKIITPSFELQNATLEEATAVLTVQSKLRDPKHQGIQFLIQPQASKSAKPVTLTLENVSLGSALRYVCALAGVKSSVQDYAVILLAANETAVSAAPSKDSGVIARSDNQAAEDTVRKLKSMVIDHIAFTNTPIDVALRFFAQKSKELDHDGRGINFVLGPADGVTTTRGSTDSAVGSKLTFQLESTSLYDLVRCICQQANLKCSIEDNTVYLRP